MSYTDVLESKHHYLDILKESDKSRRAIERNFTPDKANEYNKIMAIRNAAFINLIKEGVPFVENEEKDSLRIMIDDEPYDIKKGKLKTLVGDSLFESIMERSHEHERTLSFMKKNNIPAPSDTSLPQEAPQTMTPFQMPAFHNPYISQYPTMPQMAPLGGMYPGMPMMTPYGIYPSPYMPQIPQQSTSEAAMHASIDELTNKLNQLAENMQPQVHEVVVDDQIKDQLNKSQEELRLAKEREEIANKRAESALETIQNIRADFDVERIKHEMLEGNYNALIKERDSLKMKIDSVRDVASYEIDTLNKQIETLEKEKEKMEQEHAEASMKIKENTELELKKQKALLDIERQKHIDAAERKIQEIQEASQQEIDKLKTQYAAQSEEYEQQIKASNDKIKEIQMQTITDTEHARTESSEKIQALESQMREIQKERDDAQRQIEQIKRNSKAEIQKAQQSAQDAINRANADNSAINNANAKIKEKDLELAKIKKDTEEKIRIANEDMQKKIAELEKKIETAEETAKEKEKEARFIKEDAQKRIKEAEENAAAQIHEIEKSATASDYEISEKMERIKRESEAKVLEMKNELKEKERLLKQKEEQLSASAQNEMQTKLQEVRKDFENRQNQLAKQHENEILAKTKELEEAQKKIEESQKQISLLNESLKVHKELAYYDVLTGIKNKNAFNNDFGEITGDFSFVMISINGMREFNKQGREFGDNVLKFVANEIQSHISKNVYRIIGDSFGVVVNESSETVEKRCALLKAKLIKENIIYIAYGSCDTSQTADKGEIVKIAETNMNIMRASNRAIISEIMEQQQSQSVYKQTKEETIKKNDSGNSIVEFVDLKVVDGKLVTQQISQDETDYEYMKSLMENSSSSEEMTGQSDIPYAEQNNIQSKGEASGETQEIEAIEEAAAFNMDVFMQSDTLFQQPTTKVVGLRSPSRENNQVE